MNRHIDHLLKKLRGELLAYEVTIIVLDNKDPEVLAVVSALEEMRQLIAKTGTRKEQNNE